MAILDERTEFCDAVTLGTAVATANVGDVIDLGANQRAAGSIDNPLYLVISVATGIESTLGGTLAFQLVSDTDANPPSTTTATVHWRSPLFTTSSTSDTTTLAAGTKLAVFQLPPEAFASYERYLGIQSIVAGNVLTAGAIDAYLTPTPPTWKAYDAPYQA